MTALGFGPGTAEACVTSVHMPPPPSSTQINGIHNSTLGSPFPGNNPPITGTSYFALSVDNQTILVDTSGSPHTALDWSTPVPSGNPNSNGNSSSPAGVPSGPGPKWVVHCPPYLVALHDKLLTVATAKPQASIQTVSLTKPRVLATSQSAVPSTSQVNKSGSNSHSNSFLYVVSETQMWILSSVAVGKQLKQLIKDKQFDLAVTLLTSQPVIDQQKVIQLQTWHAFHLFCQGNYKSSLERFYDLDPVLPDYYVIGMYGDLLPKEVQADLNELFPEPLPKFESGSTELEESIRELIHYLTRMRNKTTLELTDNNNKKKSVKASVEVLDTTLVKCYLKVYDKNGRGLLTPFLRTPDKQCHLRETESVFKEAGKYDELTVFYKTRGLHDKALSMLKKLFHTTVGQTENYGRGKTVAYLTQLEGVEKPDIDRICKFAEPVVRASPEAGLEIFTAETPEMLVEKWDRKRAYDFLSKKAPRETVVKYLEFIINNWSETDSYFHNALVLHYKDIVVEDVSWGDEADTDQGALKAHTLEKMRGFLEASKHYRADSVLAKFPRDCFFEERALLLGSLGRHVEALSIHLFKLRSKEGALAYCRTHGGSPFLPQQSQSQADEVYTILYRMLTSPPGPDSPIKELESMGLTKEDLVSHRGIGPVVPDVELALEILYSHSVDVMTVIECTPPSVPLEKLSAYLEASLEGRQASRHHAQLHRGLLHSEHLQIQEERISAEADRVEVREQDTCPVCQRYFRSQVLVVRLPNGQVICYNCKDQVVTYGTSGTS